MAHLNNNNMDQRMQQDAASGRRTHPRNGSASEVTTFDTIE
jgi:hypothetical protein